jgi:hypothetical protein
MQLLKEYKNHIKITILLGAIPVLYFGNVLFLTVLTMYLLLILFTWRKIHKSLILFAVLYVIHCLLLQLSYKEFVVFVKDETVRFFLCFTITTMAMTPPVLYFFRANGIRFNIFLSKQKKYAKLICTQHLTRTQPLFLEDGGIRIVCRINDKCSNQQKLKYADKLVGVIGKTITKHIKNKNYYVNLWDHSKNVVKDGDYDVIEVYLTAEINDYNSVLTQVMGYFYNDLRGFKPMNEIVINVYGELHLTQNTMRLLEKNFKDVRYYKTP